MLICNTQSLEIHDNNSHNNCLIKYIKYHSMISKMQLTWLYLTLEFYPSLDLPKLGLTYGTIKIWNYRKEDSLDLTFVPNQALRVFWKRLLIGLPSNQVEGF